MCLILFAKNCHPKYKLILIANRDEFYNRPTKELHKWASGMYAGKDLQAGGTWMGIAGDGKFAALTNFRAPNQIDTTKRTRGHLVSRFLTGNQHPYPYLESVHHLASTYNGFNLLCGSPDALFYYSNIQKKIIEIEDGIHGLSNAFLNTDWPKVTKGKHQLKHAIQAPEITISDLFQILSDKEKASDETLPSTGVSVEWERKLSPLFIQSETYGTRCSSIITIDKNNAVQFIERSFYTNSFADVHLRF